MYICVCNAISESELRRMARLAPGGVEAVYAALGKQPQCATCMMDAEEILHEERQSPVKTADAA